MQTSRNSTNNLWVARDKDEMLYIYRGKPKKLETLFYADYDLLQHSPEMEYFSLPKDMYPEVTWENSPKELIINKPKTIEDYEEDW